MGQLCLKAFTTSSAHRVMEVKASWWKFDNNFVEKWTILEMDSLCNKPLTVNTVALTKSSLQKLIFHTKVFDNISPSSVLSVLKLHIQLGTIETNLCHYDVHWLLHGVPQWFYCSGLGQTCYSGSCCFYYCRYDKYCWVVSSESKCSHWIMMSGKKAYVIIIELAKNILHNSNIHLT